MRTQGKKPIGCNWGVGGWGAKKIEGGDYGTFIKQKKQGRGGVRPRYGGGGGLILVDLGGKEKKNKKKKNKRKIGAKKMWGNKGSAQKQGKDTIPIDD